MSQAMRKWTKPATVAAALALASGVVSQAAAQDLPGLPQPPVCGTDGAPGCSGSIGPIGYSITVDPENGTISICVGVDGEPQCLTLPRSAGMDQAFAAVATLAAPTPEGNAQVDLAVSVDGSVPALCVSITVVAPGQDPVEQAICLPPSADDSPELPGLPGLTGLPGLPELPGLPGLPGSGGGDSPLPLPLPPLPFDPFSLLGLLELLGPPGLSL